MRVLAAVGVVVVLSVVGAWLQGTELGKTGFGFFLIWAIGAVMSVSVAYAWAQLRSGRMARARAQVNPRSESAPWWPGWPAVLWFYGIAVTGLLVAAWLNHAMTTDLQVWVIIAFAVWTGLLGIPAVRLFDNVADEVVDKPVVRPILIPLGFYAASMYLAFGSLPPFVN